MIVEALIRIRYDCHDSTGLVEGAEMARKKSGNGDVIGMEILAEHIDATYLYTLQKVAANERIRLKALDANYTDMLIKEFFIECEGEVCCITDKGKRLLKRLGIMP